MIIILNIIINIYGGNHNKLYGIIKIINVLIIKIMVKQILKRAIIIQ